MLTKLVLTTLVVVLLTVTRPTSGQVLQGGRCRPYQGSANFTEEFISKLKSEERSYLFALSSGPTLACQRVKFFNNDTFFYSYSDATGTENNYTGKYVATAQSATNMGSIRLTGIPLTVLQAGFNGTNLRVVTANDEQLVVVSCLNLGLISIETVGGLVAEEKYYTDKNNTIKRISDTVKAIDFYRPEEITLQTMSCVQSRENFLKIFDLLVKFGIIPNIPFLRNIVAKLVGEGGGGDEARLYSAYGGMPFYPAPVNYPIGNPQQFGQQGGYFVPYGAAGFPQGPSFAPSTNSQFRPPFYPQHQIPQTFTYPQHSQNSLYSYQVPQMSQVPQMYNRMPQGFNRVQQSYPQVPQSFVYPPVGDQPIQPKYSSSPVASPFKSTPDYAVAVPLLTNALDSAVNSDNQKLSRSDSLSLLSQFDSNDPTYNPFLSPLMSD